MAPEERRVAVVERSALLTNIKALVEYMGGTVCLPLTNAKGAPCITIGAGEDYSSSMTRSVDVVSGQSKCETTAFTMALKNGDQVVVATDGDRLACSFGSAAEEMSIGFIAPPVVRKGLAWIRRRVVA